MDDIKRKSNLLISYILKNNNFEGQVKEELELKNEIAKLLSDKGYKFIIADDDLINEKLITK